MRKKLLRSRSGFEKPESREEAIMQNILGASNVLEPSESNIEEILKSILYNTPYTKEAEFEIEKILLAIKNNGTYDGEGESRDMKILIAILNDLDYTEEAESRIEELYVEWLHQRSSIKVLEGVPPLSFTAKGKPLTAWSITGNTVNPVEVVGVGDYDSETGLYKIPVVTRGKNLLKLKEVNLTVQGVTISIKNNSITVKGTSKASGGRTTYLSGNFVLQPGTYFISGDIVNGMVYCLTDVSNGKAVIASSASKFTLTEKTKVAFGLNFIKGVSYDATVSVMLNEGNKILPYEPYHEPITTPIYLPTPLYSGEVMRSDGTITRSDGTTETFTAPQIPTINGTTVIDVDTAVKPESIYIEYK